jgi:radical SAM protein with 4Fe4S-binding SPASM domain
VTARHVSQPAQKRLALWRHVPLAAPWVVYVEPSGFCNLRCKFCVHRDHDAELGNATMSEATFDALMRGVDWLPAAPKLLRFCGNGEPLLNPRIVAMLERAKQVGPWRVEVITNGALLGRHDIGRLARAADRVVVSVVGLCAADYLETAGRRADFAALIENVKRLHAEKACTVHVKIHSDAVLDPRRRALFFSTFRNICDEISVERIAPLFPAVSVPYRIDGFRFGSDGPARKRLVCPQIFKSLQVCANGDAVPCCVDWQRTNLLGNVTRDSLAEMWRGDQLRALQTVHLAGGRHRIDPCRSCRMNEHCERDWLDAHSSAILARL